MSQDNNKTTTSERKTDNAQQTSPQPEKKQHKKSNKGTSNAGLFLLLLAILIVLAASGFWSWEQFTLHTKSIQNQTQALAQKLSQQQQQTESLSANLQNIQNQQQGTRQTIENIAQQQQQLTESVQSLYNEINKGRYNRWIVAESQYLINIANHRLYLAHDINGATESLKAADQRLRALGDPSLLSARTALADDISKLQSVPAIDIAGHSAQLIGLQNRVNDLAILTPEPQPETQKTTAAMAESDSEIKKAGARFMDSLKDLVKIRHKQGGEAIRILPAEQSNYLRHNIRIKLEVARLALLQQDNTLFQDSLAISRDWIERYFRKDAVYAAMLNQLQVLSELDLDIQYPDISASRTTLQQWVSTHNNQEAAQ